MNARVLSRVFTAAVAAGMALPLLAAAADSMHKKVQLGTNVTVAGKALQAGNYDLTVDGNQAKFELKGKVVAEVPCTWKTLPAKSDHDIVVTDKDAVTEIEFKGETQAIDF
jgi:hypothetical protein